MAGWMGEELSKLGGRVKNWVGGELGGTGFLCGELGGMGGWVAG